MLKIIMADSAPVYMVYYKVTPPIISRDIPELVNAKLQNPLQMLCTEAAMHAPLWM